MNVEFEVKRYIKNRKVNKKNEEKKTQNKFPFLKEVIWKERKQKLNRKIK